MAAVPRVTNCGLDEACWNHGRRRIGVLELGGELCRKFRQGFRGAAGHDLPISLDFKYALCHSPAGPRRAARTSQVFYHGTVHSIFSTGQPIRRTTAERVLRRRTQHSGGLVSYGLCECHELLIAQPQYSREFRIVDGSAKNRREPFRGAEQIDILANER